MLNVSRVPDHRSRLDIADGAMLSVALLWAGNNIYTKAILGSRIEPFPYVAVRFTIVAVLLFGWFAASGVDPRVRREDVRQFVLAGVTGYAAYNLLFVVGLSRTTAFAAAIMVSLGPIFTLIFTAALRLERVRPVQWVGVAISFSGVAVFVSEKLTSGRPAGGDLFNLLGAASFAVYTVATRPLIYRYGSAVVTAWSVLIGLVAVLPLCLPGLIAQDWGGVGLKGWTGMAYAGIGSMLIGYTLWGWAIKRRGVGRAAPYLFLVPIVTGALSAAMLDEPITALKVTGAGLVLAGVALARRSHAVGAVAASGTEGETTLAQPATAPTSGR